MNKKKINRKLFVILLISAITLSLLSASVEKVLAASMPANVSVMVEDSYTDSKVENATVTIIKHPLNKGSINIVANASAFSDKAATFSLTTGKYSVSAYHPDFGHAVQVINVTSDMAGKAVPIKLKLKPVAENWTDLDGVTYEKLISWPLKTESILSTKTSTEGQKTLGWVPPGSWILLDEQHFYTYETKVGEVYSTEGLTVDLDLKFSSSIETKISVYGGALSVLGYSQSSSTTVVSMPSVSNGASRTIKNNYDYVYQLWLVNFFVYIETWAEDGIYAGSAHYDTPYPTASYKTLPADDIIDATDTPSYQTKEVIKTYSHYQGASWTVGSSVTLSGSWNYFSGSVGLGGTYGFTSYSGNEDVYTLNLQGGRVVNIYEWNNAGSEAAGTILTYQNRYWVSSILSSGCLSGGGSASNANNLIGKANDGNYAAIGAPNYGDAGYIRATMNTAASGHIYIYGYSVDGYYNSHLYTYVSPNDSDWYLAGEAYVYYQDGLQFIDAGYYSGTFSYISIVGYDDNGYSVNLRLDAVHAVK